MYVVTRDDLYLVPTAEVPVTNIHRDEIIEAARLPIRYVAYSPCFRREAGAAGRSDARHPARPPVRQGRDGRFDAPADSAATLEWLTERAEVVLQRLGLAYRVQLMATGDMGFTQAKKYDLEVWAPGVEDWLEVTSVSNFRDFQARRMNIRWRPRPAPSRRSCTRSTARAWRSPGPWPRSSRPTSGQMARSRSLNRSARRWVQSPSRLLLASLSLVNKVMRSRHDDTTSNTRSFIGGMQSCPLMEGLSMSMGWPGRARYAIVSMFVLALLALALPATATAAGGYNVVTINAECRGMAGNGWHTHEIKLKAKIVAKGTTPTDLLTIRSTAQRQKADGSWVTVANFPGVTSSFTPDGTTHSLQVGRQYLMPTTDEQYGLRPHRIKMRLTAFEGETTLFRDVLVRTCVN